MVEEYIIKGGDKKMGEYVATEVLTTGWCPLNCQYCYIPKTEKMKQLHKSIISKIRSGEWVESIKNKEYIGLWGTEPILTILAIKDKLDTIKKNNPRLKEISFSTSMILHPRPFADFIIKAGELNIPSIDMQISLDGPEWITDNNRMQGATKKVIKNTKMLIEMLNDKKLSTRVKIHWKATLTIDNIRAMNRNISLIHEYYKFFEELTDELKKLNKNKNVIIENSSAPTLVVPGKYTADDGKELAKFFEHLYQFHYPNTYVYRLLRLWDYKDELHKVRMFTCSGGDSNIGFDGKYIHICHRTFYLNNREYIDSILNMDKYKNWDVSNFERGSIENVNKYFIVDPNDEFNTTRFAYVMRGYHDFLKFRLSATIALIKELAMTGQALPIYLRDDRRAELLALFLHTALSCPMENLLNTGSIHIVPVSLVRAFANGAFEVLLKEVRRIVSG